MSGLFDIQASSYAASRPTYPPSLFSFLSSLTPNHELAWDVGTGNGQAAVALSSHYDKVIGTDVSQEQLKFAKRLPNIAYHSTSSNLTTDELRNLIGPDNSVDLITVAQAVHWFDLDHFYSQVKNVLRKPGGVIAAWCYSGPVVNPNVDAIYLALDKASEPYWKPLEAKHSIDDEYKSLYFPFEAVLEDDEQGTGPVHFNATKEMTLGNYLTYLSTWSAVQNARREGVELLTDDVQKAFKAAWGGCEEEEVKTVTFHGYLRVGTVSHSREEEE